MQVIPQAIGFCGLHGIDARCISAFHKLHNSHLHAASITADEESGTCCVYVKLMELVCSVGLLNAVNLTGNL